MITLKMDEKKAIEIAINEVPANIPKEIEIDPYGPNWAELMKVAAETKCQSYTIIYRDVDGNLKEAWHWLNDMNFTYVRNKYKHEKKEILYFEPKTLDFGQRLAQISGNSKVVR